MKISLLLRHSKGNTMGQISVKWSWSSKKRRDGRIILGLAKVHPNGFQVDGTIDQMRWIMNNVNGAFFKFEEFDPKGHPEALLFIAPDELALARLVRNM